MADVLTQIQTCLDQLATQFYATIAYLNTYHDHSPAIPPENVPSAIPQLNKIPKNPPAAPAGTSTNTPGAQPDVRDAAGPSNAPQVPDQQAQAQDQEQPQAQSQDMIRPDSPNTFISRQRELARDLIIKEQQIEYLISVLPGIRSTEAEQQQRIKQLAEELRVVEEERTAKRREMRKLGERVDGLLEAVSRGTNLQRPSSSRAGRS